MSLPQFIQGAPLTAPQLNALLNQDVPPASALALGSDVNSVFVPVTAAALAAALAVLAAADLQALANALAPLLPAGAASGGYDNVSGSVSVGGLVGGGTATNAGGSGGGNTDNASGSASLGAVAASGTADSGTSANAMTIGGQAMTVGGQPLTV